MYTKMHAMTQCYPRSMVENDQTNGNALKKTRCSLLSGFGESLEQYKASEALVSWFHCVITHVYLFV